MKKKLLLAVILLIVGVLLGIAALCLVDFDFSLLDTTEYVTETYDAVDDFADIQIHADISDIRFAVSDDFNCKVVSRHRDYMEFSAEVKNSVLVIRETDHREWYEQIGIFWGNSGEVTVYLPKGTYHSLFAETDTGDISVPREYTFDSAELHTDTGDIHYKGGVEGDLKVETDTGDVILKGINTPGNITLETDTGDVILEGINTTGNITLETDTGDITLNNVISKKLKIEADTGDVKFNQCDAEHIKAETDTGDVTGSLLSTKIFIVDSSTGKVIVPESIGSDKCEIFSSTGDVLITVD